MEIPWTRETLLTRIRAEIPGDAWRELVRFYGPVVYRFARQRGLGDDDAAQLMLEVFQSMALNTETLEYDPKRGTLSAWFFTVTCDKLGKHAPDRPDRPCLPGENDSRLVCFAERGVEVDSGWQTEYERQLTGRALDRVKEVFPPSFWEAFWRSAVHGQPAHEVGRELEMSPGAVFVAKSRVQTRLREEIRRLQIEVDGWPGIK